MILNKPVQQTNKQTTNLLNTRTAAIIQWSLQYSVYCVQTAVTADTTWTQSISQLLPYVHTPKSHCLYAIWRAVLSNRTPATSTPRPSLSPTDCSVHTAKPTPCNPSVLHQPFAQRYSRLTHSTRKPTDLPTDIQSNQFELSKPNTDLRLVLSYWDINPLTL